MKTHFSTTANWNFKYILSECGMKGRNLTTDPYKVTCERCKKTKSYLEELAIKWSTDATHLEG